MPVVEKIVTKKGGDAKKLAVYKRRVRREHPGASERTVDAEARKRRLEAAKGGKRVMSVTVKRSAPKTSVPRTLTESTLPTYFALAALSRASVSRDYGTPAMGPTRHSGMRELTYKARIRASVPVPGNGYCAIMRNCSVGPGAVWYTTFGAGGCTTLNQLFSQHIPPVPGTATSTVASINYLFNPDIITLPVGDPYTIGNYVSWTAIPYTADPLNFSGVKLSDNVFNSRELAALPNWYGGLHSSTAFLPVLCANDSYIKPTSGYVRCDLSVPFDQTVYAYHVDGDTVPQLFGPACADIPSLTEDQKFASKKYPMFDNPNSNFMDQTYGVPANVCPSVIVGGGPTNTYTSVHVGGSSHIKQHVPAGCSRHYPTGPAGIYALNQAGGAGILPNGYGTVLNINCPASALTPTNPLTIVDNMPNDKHYLVTGPMTTAPYPDSVIGGYAGPFMADLNNQFEFPDSAMCTSVQHNEIGGPSQSSLNQNMLHYGNEGMTIFYNPGAQTVYAQIVGEQDYSLLLSSDNPLFQFGKSIFDYPTGVPGGFDGFGGSGHNSKELAASLAASINSVGKNNVMPADVTAAAAYAAIKSVLDDTPGHRVTGLVPPRYEPKIVLSSDEKVTPAAYDAFKKAAGKVKESSPLDTLAKIAERVNGAAEIAGSLFSALSKAGVSPSLLMSG